jgi:tRNA dimethylallyltransferase
MNKTCIIIAGPTAVGKTAVAIELARHFSTEIISADSRQCCTQLNIGVAKPSPQELSLVHHYFINSHSVTDTVSAADYEKYALHAIAEIFTKSDVAVMAGGTGLYIKAFCEGLDPMPPTNEDLRKTIVNNYNNGGIEWLQQEVKKQDPAYFIKGEIFNPQRMIRALEVKFSSGKSITWFQQKKKKERDFNIIKFGLELPRPVLYDRINARVEDMLAAGLVEEAQNLLPFRNYNALQTVGYRELFDYFDKKISLSDAINMIKQNTRHYAKRQLTWFKKDEQMHWLDMRDPIPAIEKIMQKAW